MVCVILLAARKARLMEPSALTIIIMVCVILLAARVQIKPVAAVISDSLQVAASQAEILQQFRLGISKDPLQKLSTWSNSSFVCDRWSGVSCDNQSMVVSVALPDSKLEGSITPFLGSLHSLVSIDLSSNALSGQVPSSLGMLSQLESLKLSSNDFTGAIPASLSNCTSLALLDFAKNRFFYSIPAQLGSLPHLKAMFLSHNLLQGAIPASLDNCSSLQFLDLSHNHLEGSIPHSVGNLTNLLSFALASNTLTGEIPGEIGDMVALQGLDLRNNAFKGGVPVLFAACRFLAVVKLSNNKLSGGIPAQLGQMQSLRVLYLDENLLSGGIPASLGGCTNMEDLIVSHNLLSGRIPASVAGLPNLLFSFSLSHNSLTGPIPPQIASMSKVQTIDLAHNMVSGSIPTGIGLCKGLQSLDLSSNQLSGSIPPIELGSLLSLTFTLNLSHNALRGPIPALEQLTYLTRIDLSSNQLNGSIPPNLTNLPNLALLNVSFNRLEGCFSQINQSYLAKHPAALLVQGNPNLCVPFLPGLCQNNACSSTSRLNWYFWMLLCLAFLFLAIGIYFYKTEFPRLRCYYRNLKRRPREIVVRSLSHRVLLQTVLHGARRDAGSTDYVSEGHLIGSGASSDVYRVHFSSGQVLAVKLFKSNTAVHRFNTECKAMTNIKHRNLVAIRGMIQHGDKKAIFMDYMENGSLKHQLYGNMQGGRHLDFGMRLGIARDIAEGLSYLHHDAHEPLIHCDLKPANILLDHNFTAFIADFGLASDLNCGHHVPDALTRRQSTTFRLRGTTGYIAPEYGAFRTVPSTQGDVYSYGVILLELLTRRQASSGPFPEGCYSLPAMVRAAAVNRSTTLESILDPVLQDLIRTTANGAAQISVLIKIALSCASDDPTSRPTMKEVANALKAHPILCSKIPTAMVRAAAACR